DANRSLAHLQGLRHVAVRHLTVGDKELLQMPEDPLFACLAELCGQAIRGSLQQGESPGPLVDPVRARSRIRRAGSVQLLAGSHGIEVNEQSRTSPLLRLLAIPLIGQKVSQRSDEECS